MLERLADNSEEEDNSEDIQWSNSEDSWDENFDENYDSALKLID